MISFYLLVAILRNTLPFTFILLFLNDLTFGLLTDLGYRYLHNYFRFILVDDSEALLSLRLMLITP